MYVFITDPSHGWLRVPLADLPEGFEPSAYSFRDGTYAYLEEDCDAPAFIKWTGLDLQPSADWCKQHHCQDFNRFRDRFPGPAQYEKPATLFA